MPRAARATARNARGQRSMSAGENETTCIRNAEWVIGWDDAGGRHVYRRDCDVVFTGDRVDFVGRGYEGPVDVPIDGRGRLVLPGLVDLHAHPATEPAQKGLREEHAAPAMYMSSLYERSIAYRPDPEGRRAGAEVAYAEMLASGVTTLADLSSAYEGWLELAARSGLRVFLAPGYASASWRLERAHELLYDWDEAAGRRGFERALAIVDEAARHPCGRLAGLLYPAQIDTCSEALLRDSAAAAAERGLPLTTHAAQSVIEWNEMVRRHGQTPVEWAHAIGLLGPRTVLGHAIFIDAHSWLHWPARRDLDLIAASGASVAHCPTPFSRYGQTLEHLGRYLRAGVTVGLGTDCAPHNLIEEMRTALILARIAAEDATAVTTADALHAATVGGARALGREDLGRLAPGCRADLVVVDLEHASMRPAREPLRSLVYTAAERAVRDVYVAGRQVVAGGRVLTLDREDALARLEAAQSRMIARVPEHDYRGRTADEIAPPVLPIAD